MRISDWSSDVCSSDLNGTLIEASISHLNLSVTILCVNPAGNQVQDLLLHHLRVRYHFRFSLRYSAVRVANLFEHVCARSSCSPLIGMLWLGLCLCLWIWFAALFEIGRASCRERVCQSV